MSSKLAAIILYPVKSLGGIELERSRVTSQGLQGDRRWVIVDDQGQFLSQRSHPSLALVQVRVQGLDLHLKAPGQESLVLKPPVDGPRAPVTIWKDTVEAAMGSELATAWFSSYLGQTCRVAFMDDACRRRTALPADLPEQLVSFADGFPCLITSTGSLDLLNTKLKVPVPMNRFRANLVVTGCAPHQEDTWEVFRIGGAVFRAVKPCSRCSVPTIDQATGQPSETQEPLRTLASYRSQPGGVMFGMNLIVEEEGDLEVGDTVRSLN